MPFYIRKSLRRGPIRLNLSKSGLGISVGVRGFRIGAGPRGSYIHAGRGGIYYRSSSAGTTSATGRQRAGHVAASPTALQYFETVDLSQLSPSSEQEFLREVEMRIRPSRLTPWAVFGSIVVGGMVICGGASSPAVGAWAAGSVLLALVALGLDKRASVLSVDYQLDNASIKAWGALERAMSLWGATTCWHVEAKATSSEVPPPPLASDVLSRTNIRVPGEGPPFLGCNIQLPSISAGRQTLLFMPDRLLVFDKAHAGAASYGSLEVRSGMIDLSEDGPVPPDAEILGERWLFQRKDGEADLRYKGNRIIPLVRYEEILLVSEDGLSELFHVSGRGVASAIKKAVAALRKA